MATKGKKKSAAYRLIHEETGHHYVIRLGREGFDKMKEKMVRKYHPRLKTHVEYKLRKLK